MSRLVYESKGLSKQHRVFCIVAPILLIAGGVFFICLANAKHAGTMIYTSTYSGIAGGGYLLKENARDTFKTLGIIICIFAAVIPCGLLNKRKSYIKVFDDHIEGCYGGMFIKQYSLKYSQISHVQPPAAIPLITPSFIITAGADRYVCQVEGAQRAYQEISSRI